MYTECPECRSAFRLTVTVLRQAHGRVRCGRCGEVFDALEYLKDESGDPESPAAGQTGAGERFERRSRELLETLDELAGPDEVRIEDTGVEWRVYDDEESDGGESPERSDAGSETGSIRWYLEDPETASEDAGAGDDRDDATAAAASRAPSIEDTRDWHLRDDHEEPAPAFDDTQTRLDLGRDPGDEMRYDDNTPLPDDEGEPAPSPPTPRRREEDFAPTPLDHEFQVDLALGDPDDWRALLNEVDAEDEARKPDTGEGPAPGTPVADENVPRLDDRVEPAARQDADDAAGHEAASSPSAAEASGIAAERELDEALRHAETGAERAGDDLAVDLQIDEDPIRELEDRDAGSAGDESALPTDSGLYETIVMEGDTVSAALEDDDEERQDQDEAPAAAATATAAEEPAAVERPAAEEEAARRPAWQGIAAASVLGLLLAAQLVHANREALATIEPVRDTLDPIYRALGEPLTPAWNIRGWQFEATSGSTDASGERLTIYSRISNESDGPLPHPLVHVSLTDRFEEVIGSRILAPGDYLAGNSDPERAVRPGRNFTAVITIDGPAEEATGFKLNVCYRLASERLRCATEDFKD